MTRQPGSLELRAGVVLLVVGQFHGHEYAPIRGNQRCTDYQLPKFNYASRSG